MRTVILRLIHSDHVASCVDLQTDTENDVVRHFNPITFTDDTGAKPSLQQPAGTCFVASQNRTPSQSETLKREIYGDSITSSSQYPHGQVTGSDVFALSPHLSSLTSITQVRRFAIYGGVCEEICTQCNSNVFE